MADPHPDPKNIAARRKAAGGKLTGPSTTPKRGGAKSTKRSASSAKRGKSKYRAKGRRIDGKWFASTAEGDRYEQLKELQEQGVIDQLECQVPFRITVNNKFICKYIADFRYRVLDDRGNTVRIPVEDVKGMMMDLYKLKKKLVEATYSFEIVEIPSKDVPKWAGRTA